MPGFEQSLDSTRCGSSFDAMADAPDVAVVALVLGVLFAYVGPCWLFGRGQTVGKRLVGLRVIRTS